MVKNKYFNVIKKSEKKAEIHIFGDIISEEYRFDDADTSAVSFKKELDALGDVNEIEVHINSGGGFVFEGLAVHNMLKSHKAKIKVYIEGLAGSISSVIAMAGDEIYMASNSLLMIHNATGVFVGDYRDMEKAAQTLRTINSTVSNSYLSRDLTVTEAKLQKMMDDETWMDADTALHYGFADYKTEALQVAASVSNEALARYRNAPDDLFKRTAVAAHVPKVSKAPKKNSAALEALLRFGDHLEARNRE
ncbi:head maturation protease, ClpP-related [Planococcus rifietoensis]|uniref:head maturation protease, ClpP-related n=1 Tax=Planococcus rifietoensis TaxID=200991 RepID=UPI00384EE886